MLTKKGREQYANDLKTQIAYREKLKSHSDLQQPNETLLDKQKRIYEAAYDRHLNEAPIQPQSSFLNTLSHGQNPHSRFAQQKQILDSKRQMIGTQQQQSYDFHPTKNYPHQQSTATLEKTFKMADSLIKEDTFKGKYQVEDQLNTMVKSYEGPTIFNNSKRAKYLPTHYRESNPENKNRILNNNTTLRVFNRNNPLSNDLEPLLDQNVAGIKPKHWMLSYEQDNPGILRRNKSQHMRDLYTQQKIDSSSQQTNTISNEQSQPFKSIADYYQTVNHYTPLMHSGSTQVLDGNNQHAVGKVGNSFEENVSRKKEFNRMVENQVRNEMLAHDFISKPSQRQGNDMPLSKMQHDWKQSNFKTLSVLESVPEDIINKNQFYQIDKIYKTSKATQRQPNNDHQFNEMSQIAKSGKFERLNQPFHDVCSPMISNSQIALQPNWESNYKSYRGLGRVGSMEQFHPDISNKPHFKDLLTYSKHLDKNITSQMRNNTQVGKVHLF